MRVEGGGLLLCVCVCFVLCVVVLFLCLFQYLCVLCKFLKNVCV